MKGPIVKHTIFVLLFALSTPAFAEDKHKGAGSKGHVTAYEADGKTVIEVQACAGNEYTKAPCGQTFRDKIKDTVCKAKGPGKHKWKYQTGDGAGKGLQTENTAICK